MLYMFSAFKQTECLMHFQTFFLSPPNTWVTGEVPGDLHRAGRAAVLHAPAGGQDVLRADHPPALARQAERDRVRWRDSFRFVGRY